MNDEKTAADYKVQGGSVLHLVLALRGGQQQTKQEKSVFVKKTTINKAKD